jgi:hypothetical protein
MADMHKNIDLDLVQFVNKIIKCNPSQRSSMEELICDPIFAVIRNPDCE